MHTMIETPRVSAQETLNEPPAAVDLRSELPRLVGWIGRTAVNHDAGDRPAQVRAVLAASLAANRQGLHRLAVTLANARRQLERDTPGRALDYLTDALRLLPDPPRPAPAARAMAPRIAAAALLSLALAACGGAEPRPAPEEPPAAPEAAPAPVAPAPPCVTPRGICFGVH